MTGAGLKYIIGQKIPEIPYIVEQWQHKHPKQDPEDQLVLAQPWSRGPAGAQYQEMIYYQYRTDRARRTLKGIDEQVRKAQTATAGQATVKRNRFIKLTEAKIECELKKWSTRPAPWPARRATPPTSTTPPRSS